MRQEQPAGGHAADAAGAIRRVRVPSPAAAVMLAALALVLILYGAYLVLIFLARDFRGLAENAADIPALVFAALGAVVARHQPRNPIGWLLAACGGLYLLTSVTGLYTVLDFRVHHGTLPMGRAAVLIGASVFLIGVIIGLVIVLFPDGTLPSRRWRPVLWAYAAACAMYLVHLFIGQSTVLAVSHVQVGYSGYPLNLPAPSGAAARVAALGGDFFLVILACWACFVGRQVLSYRRAAGEHRQQLKWLMSGAAICIVAGVAIIFSGGADSPGAQAAQVAGSLGDRGAAGRHQYRDPEISAVRHRPDHLPDPGLRHRHRPGSKTQSTWTRSATTWPRSYRAPWNPRTLQCGSAIAIEHRLPPVSPRRGAASAEPARIAPQRPPRGPEPEDDLGSRSGHGRRFCGGPRVPRKD
jgi:drug/metabolite transporter superfamily protein YnfA